jgi:hypothetical protein
MFVFGFDPAAGVAYAVVAVVMVGLLRASGQLLWVRVWFGSRGSLPWRVASFLEDAHRRGVLRQVGTAYQFRHARLQDHLAGNDHEPRR